MDAAHLHTGIEEEDARCQYEVVEIGQVGEETTMKVQLRMSASGKVDDSQHHEQARGDDGAHQAANLRHLAHPRHAFERDEGGKPIDSQYHDERVETVRRQCHIVRTIHTDEGQ